METSIVIACPSIGKCHCHNNTQEGSLYCDYECHAQADRWAAPNNVSEEHPQGTNDFYNSQQLLYEKLCVTSTNRRNNTSKSIKYILSMGFHKRFLSVLYSLVSSRFQVGGVWSCPIHECTNQYVATFESKHVDTWEVVWVKTLSKS